MQLQHSDCIPLLKDHCWHYGQYSNFCLEIKYACKHFVPQQPPINPHQLQEHSLDCSELSIVYFCLK